MNKLSQLQKEYRMGPLGPQGPVGGVNMVGGLIDLIRSVGIEGKRICEVGCFLGVSTETFLQFAPSMLYAIDVWGINEKYDEADYAVGDDGWDNVEANFRKRISSYSNVEIIKNYSHKAACDFENESLDLVYIDGEHGYDAVKRDINVWLPKVKTGGALAGHDYTIEGRPHLPVFTAVNEQFEINRVEDFPDSSWLIYKNSDD
jgi:predicted O-methyltransferase YrrM